MQRKRKNEIKRKSKIKICFEKKEIDDEKNKK